jgi:uncharacterized FlaG/YvyC family protein
MDLIYKLCAKRSVSIRSTSQSLESWLKKTRMKRELNSLMKRITKGMMTLNRRIKFDLYISIKIVISENKYLLRFRVLV